MGLPISCSIHYGAQDFILPGYLSSRSDFERTFGQPLKLAARKGNLCNVAEEKRSLLNRLKEPFLLRRLKTDPAISADLPDKVQQTHECELNPKQRTAMAHDITAPLTRFVLVLFYTVPSLVSPLTSRISQDFPGSSRYQVDVSSHQWQFWCPLSPLHIKYWPHMASRLRENAWGPGILIILGPSWVLGEEDLHIGSEDAMGCFRRIWSQL